MTRTIALTTLVALLAGCDYPSDATVRARGEARQAAFVQCMELSAKMPRHSDDNVADVVAECGQQSYFLTNYIKDKP
jgi:hypothetical protein